MRLPPLARRPWPHRLAAPAAVLLLFAVSIAWPLPADLAGRGAVRSVRVTDRHGVLLRELRPDGRGVPTTLDAVAPAVVQALLAAEDRAFHRHVGIDPAAVVRAAWSNARAGRVVSGASTLTMQTARLLRGRSGARWVDKLAEAHLALRLEWHFSKDAILTLWLDRAPFGPQTTGIEAAARHYFGKAARHLTVAEAALLVGLPQSPVRYDPFRHPDAARRRQRYVLDAMAATGGLTAAEAARLAALPLALTAPADAFRAPHFVEWLRRSGLPGDAREVRTTLDAHLQARVEALARGHLRRLGAEEVGNAAAVVVENATGAVRAYVGSVDFWNARAGGQNDGVQMLRQPGSALKPFTYALALASGRYTPATVLADVETPLLEAGGAFSPANYDGRYHGPVPLRQALACSYNVPAVRLARDLGPAALLGVLRRAGFETLRRPAEHYGVGLTLGNGEVRLLDLAYAYAALARGGTRPAPRPVAWVHTAAGDTLVPAAAGTTSIGFDPAVLHLVTDILRDPDARAPAFGRGGPLELPFPAAVKTGTSKDYRDNWAVGYTPTHTVAVWAGNFDGAPMRWVSGVTGAGALLRAVFLALGDGGSFPRPAGLVEADVCPHSGSRPGAACPTRRRELFLDGTVPTDTCAVHRRVRLDAATGLLADDATPPARVRETLFTIYPPRFHPWMRANGLPFPPEVTRRQFDAGGDAVRTTDALQVLYPETGTVFQLDPVLRADYQRIHLRGSAEAGLFDVHWRVDGARLPGPAHDAPWTLRPGRHRVELHAAAADGRRLRSRPADVRVLGGDAAGSSGMHETTRSPAP